MSSTEQFDIFDDGCVAIFRKAWIIDLTDIIAAFILLTNGEIYLNCFYYGCLMFLINQFISIVWTEVVSLENTPTKLQKLAYGNVCENVVIVTSFSSNTSDQNAKCFC